MILNAEAQKAFIDLAEEQNVYIEGNILKVIEDGSSPEFRKYLDTAISVDREKRRTRLEINKSVQIQNEELKAAQAKNESLMGELKTALDEARKAKETAENDLTYLQKRTQFALINNIVQTAIYVILGVGVVTTFMYTYSLYSNKDTTLIGNTWSNMFGILLTNSFSIIGTIMGVKYASEKPKDTSS